uniref:Odorant receptor n=1 Tax=Culicoides sonorensis TaxID=179676 RepID=A0A336LBR1_CULSO
MKCISNKIRNFFYIKFYKFLPLERIQLMSIGVWPCSKCGWFILLGLFNSIFNGTTTLAEFAFAYNHRDNLEDILASLSPAFTKMNTSFKIFILVLKRKEFFVILNTLQTNYQNYMNREENNIRRKLAKRSFIICLTLSVFSQSTGIFFSVLPIFRNVYRILNGNKPVTELPFKSNWPWSIQKSPLYEITYLLQVYGSWLTSSAVAGIDCVFMGIFLHVTSEFRCISSRITEFGKNLDQKAPHLTVLNKKDNEAAYMDLKKLIHEHRTCIEFCDKLRDFGKEIILGHFLLSSVTVCMTSVNLLIAEWSQKPVYVTYILTVLTQALVYCYGGELVSNESGKISEEIYLVSWHKLNENGRRAIKMIIQRAQKSSDISVPFFTVSMPTFGNIIRVAGSYITLLNTFLDK